MASVNPTNRIIASEYGVRQVTSPCIILVRGWSIKMLAKVGGLWDER